jgi:ribonucleoside-diphosphate reductase alpha chain
MRKAKMGDWQTYEQQRYLANNSISFTEKPDVGSFMKEWNALYESKSGERGIFNRVASQKKAKENGRRIWDLDFGTNPCSEIILRPYQFCNLSEVVVRSGDTTEDLLRKVEVAAIIGTFQSTLTHFPYLRDIWTQNTEEERLLGVSLTGIMDRVWAKDGELALLKNKAIAINAQYAELLGIPVSTAITCVKPSGTVSQLVNSASGIHARYASWYARTVRGDNKDPMTQFLIAEGIPNEPAIDQPDDMTVFTFVQEAPESSFVTDDLSAIDQLNVWLKFQREWCEHKPSVTINVKEEEWPRVGAWVWDHFDEVSGISFLPLDDHVYQQAPYQKLEYEDYEVAKAQQDKIVLDWDKLSAFENGIDTTTVTQNLACSADSCEIVDIGG